MAALTQLWLPIIVTAIAVFIASSLVHMVFKWHNADFRGVANEDEVRAALRAGNLAPGQYMVPHCLDMKDLQDPAMQQKFVDGPIAMITVRPNGLPTMGRALLQWFVFNLVLAAICAVLAVQVLGIDTDPGRAGHLVGITSLLAYGAGSVSLGIWMGKPWRSVAKDVLDALIYGTVSALVFMWLWP